MRNYIKRFRKIEKYTIYFTSKLSSFREIIEKARKIGKTRPRREKAMLRRME
jgi:hypothetical protein